MRDGFDLTELKSLSDAREIADTIIARHGCKYDVMMLEDGCLLDGSYLLCVDDCVYEFREKYLNCWSSAYSIKRHKNITKKLPK